jgi:hypothetical protein
MNPDKQRLLSFALDAVADPSALPVLGDVLLEMGFDDFHIKEHVLRLVYQKQWPAERLLSSKYFEANAATPTPTFAKALAAALLFEEWGTKHWPVPSTDFEVEWRSPIGGFSYATSISPGVYVKISYDDL